MPSLGDFRDQKSLVDANKSSTKNDRGPIRTTDSQLTEPKLSMTSYGLSDAMQGMALYKPPGIGYDTFNQELSKELTDMGVEAKWQNRDDKLTPYDVFVKAPDPSTATNLGTTAQTSSTTSGGPVTPNAQGFVFPGEGGAEAWKVSQPWNNDKGGHPGVDLIAKDGKTAGKKMLAAKAGTVHQYPNDSFKGAGNCIHIDHGGGQWTIYMHMSQLIATTGTQVNTGDVIGIVGSTGQSTGAHIHFEVHEGVKDIVRWSGKDGNVNPQPYIGM